MTTEVNLTRQACAVCAQEFAMGDLMHYGIRGTIHMRCVSPRTSSCPRCEKSTSWSDFGYWVHDDTGIVFCGPRRHTAPATVIDERFASDVPDRREDFNPADYLPRWQR